MSKSKTKTRPPSPDELNQLVALYSARRYAELESRARSLTGLYPDEGFVWKLLGAALQMQGKSALAAFQKAADLMPGDAEAHFNLGVVQRSAGLLADAAASYRRALKINSAYAEAHSNLGNVLKDSGLLEEAADSYRNAVALRPDWPDAHYNLGDALQRLEQYQAAAESQRRALTLKPDFAAAHHDLGLALESLGQLDDAIASYRRVLELKPDAVQTHYNLGKVLKELGLPNEAISSYRQTLALAPGHILARSNLLFVLNYLAHYSPKSCLDEAKQYGLVVAKLAQRYTAWQCVENPQRLRVGIVSGDLRSHPVGHFLESILANLDHTQIELIAYSANPVQDDLTARIRPHFTEWRSLFKQSDADAARMIHGDGVHVLLDISGHTAHSRLPVFAWKPAPVQASWLGYFATTGVAEMDYFLADEVGVPEALQENFTESVWYLPDTRLCFTAPGVDIPVSPLPALSNGMITFGCFQNLTKVNDEVLATWGEIFAALPDARLRIQFKVLGDPVQRERLTQRLQRFGIAPERVMLYGSSPRDKYLAAHAEVDLILDTFPYPGGTTTCEALWMGVPTLTLAGDSLLARQGASMMTAAGLGEWIATSKEEYIAKAIALSGDRSKLAGLRARLRAQVLASPLFDAPRFARNLEEALWGMWRTYQSRMTQS